MSRSLTGLLFVICITKIGSAAAVLPEQWGSFRKIAAAQVPAPPDPAVFQEFGFVSSDSATYRGGARKATLSVFQMKDATGALAAWDWLRPADAQHCTVGERCAHTGNRYLLLNANYVVELNGITPTNADAEALNTALPNRHPSDVPPVLNFVPVANVIPNSARYILGPSGLRAVAPELVNANPGFDQGAEAHYTAYRLNGGTAKLVLFDYPSPEMARLHTINFKQVSGAEVKRSGVLVAVILPGADPAQAEAVLDQVRYQAKILWNEPPPPNPVPTLYKLLMNIIMISAILAALCLTAGILYGGMRLYRRRYGTLEEDEAMTTLHLTGD